MNKLIKISIAIIACILAILAGAIIFATNSAWLQTKVANDLAKSYGMRLEYFLAGLGNAKAKNVNIELADGTAVNVGSAEIEFSVFQLLSKNIDISSIKVANLVVRMPKNQADKTAEKKYASDKATPQSESSGTPPPANAKTVQGEKSTEDIQWNLSIDSADISASIIAGNGDTLDLSLKSSDIKILKGINPESGKIETICSIKSKNFQRKFLLEAALSSKAAGKTKVNALKLALSSEDIRILQAAADFSNKFESAAFEISIEADNSQIEPFLLGKIKLPKFKSKLYSKGSFSDFGKNLNAEVSTKNTISGLEVLSPELKGIGELGIDAEINAKLNKNDASFSKLGVYIIQNGKNLVSAKGLKEFSISLNGSTKVPSGELAEISINGLSPKSINPFLSGTTLTFDDIYAAFKLSCDDSGILYLNTARKIAVNNFGVEKSKDTLIEGLSFSTAFSADFQPTGDFGGKIDISTADKENVELSISARKSSEIITAKASARGAIKPILQKVKSASSINLPDIRIKSEMDASYSNGTANLSKIEACVYSGGAETPILKIFSSGFKYTAADGKIESQSSELASIESKDVPFAIFKPFTAGFDAKKLSLSGKILQPSKGSYSFNGSISVSNAYYKNGAESLISDIDASSDVEILFDGKKISAALKKANVGSMKSSFIYGDAQAEAEISPFKFCSASTKLSITLAQLLNQPVLTPFNNIMRGAADIDAKILPGSVESTISATNIALRSTGGTVDKLDAQLSATYPQDFSAFDAAVKIALKGIYGDTSANMKVSYGKDISATLNAESIAVEDILTLSQAFKNPTYAESEPEGGEDNANKKKIVRPQEAETASARDNLKVLQRADTIAKKDSKAFWDTGRKIYVAADIAKILKGSEVFAENANMKFLAEPSLLSLEKLSLKLAGAPVDIKAGISFDANADIPYLIKDATATMKGFEVSSLFNNSQRPPMTGLFSATATFEGSGNNAEHLLKYITGSAKLSAKNGILHVLDEDSVAAKGSAIAGNALKIAGRLLNNRVKELEGIGEIVSILHSVKYDDAEINVERRAPDYNIIISNSGVKTPTLIFSIERGTVYFDPNAEFKEYKLDIPVQMLISDSIRAAFTNIGEAAKESNVKNYYTGPLFEISGTVGAPSNNLLETLSGAKETVNSIIKTFF